MPDRSTDDQPAQAVDDMTTDELVESGTANTRVEDSGEEALARLGLEARAELERLRARLGLLGESSDTTPALPTVVGRYRLLERIGHGGMGVVYRAHDPELGRAVAIKLVHAAAFAAPDELRARLLREAKVLARLAHPNVVRVYDCGQHEGEVYLAMEHVEGKTLRDWQSAGVRKPEAIVDAYVAAALGLAAAHHLGIVHRDFKPDNVLVADDGRILVGDFGLALGGVEEVVGAQSDELEPSSAGVPAGMTKTGALLGTVLYMSPEQLRGDPATASSDQFAFCVALWEALAGARPFVGDDGAALLAAIESGPKHGERLPSKLRRALVRGLSFEPRDRFADIPALAGAIGRRRGPSAPLLVALVGASLGVGLLLHPLVFQPTAPAEECGLERAVVEVREHEGWELVRQRLDAAGVGAGLERLHVHLRRLEAQAEALCASNGGPGDEARRQHFQAWVESLGSMLATAGERSIDELLEDVEGLEHARLTAPPPRALDERVVTAIGDSEEHERLGDLDGALTAADRGVALAGERDLELALAKARRGRVLALREESPAAMDAYGEAAASADASTYDDARLEARLLAARTAIMRLEHIDRGRDALAEARGLLVRLQEPGPSPRRADYQELYAALLKREGRMPEALREQWLAVVQRTLLGNVRDTGLGYVNLGTIYERLARGPADLQRAHECYERALQLLLPTRPSPAWGQAAYNLGRALVAEGATEGLDRAELLLEDVRAARPDLRVYVGVDLLMLRLLRDQLDSARILADELIGMLRAHPTVPPSIVLGAWSNIAMTFAFSGELSRFDEAYAELEASAEALARSGAQPRAAIEVRRAELEVTVASSIVEDAPERARALASAAQQRLLALPVADRPADLLGAAEEILAASPD